jgi:hypothetical protein
MMKPWRLLALAAALNVMAGVGVGTAQTVVVRNAPPASTVELVLNSKTIGSAAADSAGDVKIPVNLSTHIGKTETEAQLAVDVCGDMRRVQVFERGLQPPPPGDGCDRRDVTGLFFVRRVSTLVVNLSGPNPAVLLIQGSYSLLPPGPGTLWSTPPTGLVLSGGIGLSKFRDVLSVNCGDGTGLTQCAGDESPIAYTAGATYWISPFLGVEGSYVRPKKVTFTGSGDAFRFNGSLDAELVTISGKIGAPVGPVRIYGMVGTNYHRATASTSETIDDKTITIDGVAQTITGGTQAFELKTAGWGWQFGGGMEVWVIRSLGVYAEFSRASLKGSASDNKEGTLDEGLTALMVGARLRLGR